MRLASSPQSPALKRRFSHSPSNDLVCYVPGISRDAGDTAEGKADTSLVEVIFSCGKLTLTSDFTKIWRKEAERESIPFLGGRKEG